MTDTAIVTELRKAEADAKAEWGRLVDEMEAARDRAEESRQKWMEADRKLTRAVIAQQIRETGQTPPAA
jgi:hypothetical protein